jgi:hypothetical protein
MASSASCLQPNAINRTRGQTRLITQNVDRLDGIVIAEIVTCAVREFLVF